MFFPHTFHRPPYSSDDHVGACQILFNLKNIKQVDTQKFKLFHKWRVESPVSQYSNAPNQENHGMDICKQLSLKVVKKVSVPVILNCKKGKFYSKF